MIQSLPKRLLLLGGLALLLFILLLLRWIAGWGLVTIHVTHVPLAKVMASISRQGHVRVESSLDPTQLVSMDVDKVSPAVAVDILALRTDSSWRLVYLAAPTKGEVSQGVITLSRSGKIDEWTTHYFPSPPLETESGFTLDPRRLELKIEGPDHDLAKLLDEAAQKTGVMIATSPNWLPTTQKLPGVNQACKVIPSLVASAHGKIAEFYFIKRRQTERDPASHAPPEEREFRFGDSQAMNPGWREEKQLAQIKLLHASQQEAAKQKLAEQKAFFDELKGLPPEERRAKLHQFLSNPDNIQQIQDRMLLRQANQTAEQRINRAVNYLNNKASVKASQAH